MSDLVGNPEDRFSRVAAQMIIQNMFLLIIVQRTMLIRQTYAQLMQLSVKRYKGNDQEEKAQSVKIPTPKTRVGKN